MKVIVVHNELLPALELISRINTKHATLPVLHCVLISTVDGMLSLRATNLEMSVEVLLPAKIEAPGMVAVPATTILQSVQNLSSQEVVITLDNDSLKILNASSSTSIKAIKHDEFPTLVKVKGNGVIIHKDFFTLGIKTTTFSASQSSIKPELGSVYILQKKEHSLTFVATDSFRLMEKTVPQKNVVLPQTLLIPQKNAVELSRILSILSSDPKLLITDNQCAFVFKEGVYIASRLVNGSFPDYEQIIPKEYTTIATLLKDDLQKALKKTSVFINKFMQVTLTIKKNNITIASQNTEVGQTSDVIMAQVEGDELTISFNQQYLMEALPHIFDESIIMRFSGLGRPLVITGANDTTLRYLVMPMNK
jgi:DNA polymerase-3 subunit beta